MLLLLTFFLFICGFFIARVKQRKKVSTATFFIIFATFCWEKYRNYLRSQEEFKLLFVSQIKACVLEPYFHLVRVCLIFDSRKHF